MGVFPPQDIILKIYKNYQVISALAKHNPVSKAMFKDRWSSLANTPRTLGVRTAGEQSPLKFAEYT